MRIAFVLLLILAPMTIAGDFNTDLAGGSYYGTGRGIALLRKGLQKSRLFCATEPCRMGRRALHSPLIDHIALPKRWERRCKVARAWEGKVGSPRLTDHNGVCVRIV